MKRFFNTAGPCVEGRHYLLSSTDRLREVAELIARGPCRSATAAEG